jgi:hypothetical protein
MATRRSCRPRGSATRLRHAGGNVRDRPIHLSAQHVEIEARHPAPAARARDSAREGSTDIAAAAGRGGGTEKPDARVEKELTGGSGGSIPRLIGAGRESGPGAEASSDKRRDWPAG